MKTSATWLGVSLIAFLVAPATARASSATFVITGQGIVLGEAKEEVKEGKALPPQFHAKAELGKPFTLIAQGMILPRGGKPAPGEPDKGAWTFDVKSFNRLTAEKKTDKTTIVIRLEPTALGRARVRFSGQILGYDHTFDVMVEVVEAKK